MWLCRRGNPTVSFGWIIQMKDDTILFKDDEYTKPFRVEIREIECCGAV